MTAAGEARRKWPCLVCGKRINAKASRTSVEIGEALYALHQRCAKRLKTTKTTRVALFLEVTPPTGPAAEAEFHKNPLFKLGPTR